MSNEEAIRARLKTDFPHYAARCLTIKTKDGGLTKLELNEPQRHIHERLEKQLRETGRVRALILKGRQQGCSTYVEGRFYWKVTHRKGARAYILTHEDGATANLFGMTDTFHDNCPPLVKPSTGAANAKELYFDRLSSGYKVGTAGSKATGRSSTIQFFHGSEVAYWPNAADHVAGVMQAVADLPGTEVILESTSAGPAGLFYEMCMAASRGEGDYQVIFVPWFWSSEYRKAVPAGFVLTSEEQEYKARYKLGDEQMAWRRSKVGELRGLHRFRREYPATISEAFKVAAVGALWTPEMLDGTRVFTMPRDAEGKAIPLVKVAIGVDPSGGAGENNDNAGVISAGKGADGHLYVWRDRSGKLTPDGWATRSILAYDEDDADAIVAEKNFGGEMVSTVILSKAREARKSVRVKLVHASRGKAIRAGPVLALWEQGRAHIFGRLLALEEELTTWVPGQSDWSPGRLDALVFAASEVMDLKPEPSGGGSANYWGKRS